LKYSDTDATTRTLPAMEGNVRERINGDDWASNNPQGKIICYFSFHTKLFVLYVLL